MLKRVGDVPERTRFARESCVARDVREFCRNRTYDVAEVAVEGHTARQVVQMLRAYVRKHPGQCEGVGVAKRGERAFLYRKGVGDR